jgi:glycine dehydrogenase subunit 2
LPGPVVDIIDPPQDDADAPLFGLVMPEKSIGRLKAFHGNFGMHIRAYAYIRAYGGTGLREVSRHAVLNANYIRAQLMDTYKFPILVTGGMNLCSKGTLKMLPIFTR